MSGKRVVVAMSGGVDSSVCAALLKDRGFEVVGITMQIWDRAKERQGCCGLRSVDDAKRVASLLDIPHYVLNFRDVFKKKIVEDFCQEYKRGRTPNPCIRCNQYIKFDALLKRARQINAEYVATGHYARIEYNPRKKRYMLSKGIDSRKDQSYFLYVMTQGQLQHTLMPLGNLTKTQVRQIAREKSLPVAEKPESQEICFIPDNDYGKFLKKYLPKSIQPGPIVNTKGETIGRHKGIIFYTIGQRKGIRIAHKEPLYVVEIKKRSGTIVVGSKNEVYSKKLVADQVNLIYMNKLKLPMDVTVKVRYLHLEARAILIPEAKNKVRVQFKQPQWAVTPGQAAVFYKGDSVVGGGIIKSN